MKHIIEDRLVSPFAVARVIAELNRLEAQALRFRVSKSDGQEIKIGPEHGITRSGAFRQAADLLQKLLLEAT